MNKQAPNLFRLVAAEQVVAALEAAQTTANVLGGAEDANLLPSIKAHLKFWENYAFVKKLEVLELPRQLRRSKSSNKK